MNKELLEFIEKLNNNLEVMYKHYDYKERADSKHKYMFKEVKIFIKKFHKALENEDDKMRKYYDPKKIERKTMTFLIGNNKELEALDNLAKNVEGDLNYLFKQFKQDYETVKYALIQKQKLEKAIKIIRNRNISVDSEIVRIDCYEQYKNVYCFVGDQFMITENEFNFLKELFGNGR